MEIIDNFKASDLHNIKPQELPMIYKLNHKCKDLCSCFLNSYVISQIGSVSRNAYVFKIQTDNDYAAAKILLLTNKYSQDSISNEINIAKKLSEKCDCVPKYISYHYCSSFEPSKHILNSFLYRTALKYKFLTEETKDMSKREKIIYEKEKLDDNFRLDPYKYGTDVQCYILISELASGDLRQIATNYELTVDNWESIIQKILICISKIHDENLSHNDLHLGNILIKNLYNLEPLIHDFGEVTELNRYNQFNDLDKFFYSIDIDDEIYVPDLIRLKVKDTIDKLRSDDKDIRSIWF